MESALSDIEREVRRGVLARAQAPTSTTYHLRRGYVSGEERADVTASGREKNSGRRAVAERDGRRSRSDFGGVGIGWATTDVGWRKREKRGVTRPVRSEVAQKASPVRGNERIYLSRREMNDVGDREEKGTKVNERKT